jgi:hypothetical protein
MAFSSTGDRLNKVTTPNLGVATKKQGLSQKLNEVALFVNDAGGIKA